MQKIPVGETISGAYAFAFVEFLSVLGTAWFPYVILMAFDAGVILLLAPDLPGQFMRGEFDLAFLFGIRRVEGLIWLATLVVRSMVTVGLQERALGRAQGPAFFFFSLGTPVWRMIGANVLAFLLLVLILLLTCGATAAVAFATVELIPHLGTVIAVAAVIAAVCWFIYVCVRLVFFLPAVVVAEEQIGLARSWELGGGNFWRIVAVLLAVFVPVWIGMNIVWASVVGPFIPWDLFSHLNPGMTPEELGQFYVSIVKRVLQAMRVALPFVIAFGLIEALIFLGLGNGAIAKAYLNMTREGAAA